MNKEIVLCDRCKSGKYYELCRDCHKKFLKFLKREKIKVD